MSFGCHTHQDVLTPRRAYPAGVEALTPRRVVRDAKGLTPKGTPIGTPRRVEFESLGAEPADVRMSPLVPPSRSPQPGGGLPPRLSKAEDFGVVRRHRRLAPPRCVTLQPLDTQARAASHEASWDPERPVSHQSDASPVVTPRRSGGGRSESVPVLGEKRRSERESRDLYNRECSRLGLVPLGRERLSTVASRHDAPPPVGTPPLPPRGGSRPLGSPECLGARSRDSSKCSWRSGCADPDRCSSRDSRTPSRGLPKGLMGDGQVSAWCAAGFMDEETDVSLVNASLGDQGAAAIAQRLGEQIQSLDLTGNSIAAAGCEALGRIRAGNLRSLSLAKNGLTDTAVAKLCAGLGQEGALQLQKLSLAENQISRGGRAVGDLLKVQKQLSFLDLHWNFITGDGALGLFKGLSKNAANGGALAKLDLSWNCLGNTMATLSMGELAKALSDDGPLVHLDLSYNSIQADACEILGQGLRQNHTLLGLHLVGNEAAVDAAGFVVAGPPKHKERDAQALPPSTGQSWSRPDGMLAEASRKRKPLLTETERTAIRTAFKQVDADGSGTVEVEELYQAMNAMGMNKTMDDARQLVASVDKDGNGELDIDEFSQLLENIMLKEKEQREKKKNLEMELNRDRDALEARTSCWICESWQPVELEWKGEASAVWVFTSLDNFERGTQFMKEPSGRFLCEKVLPPDQVWVYLQVDNAVATVPGLAEARLPQPLQHRLREAVGLDPISPPKNTAEVSMVSVISMGVDRREELTGQAPPRPAVCTVVLGDPNDPMGVFVAPRMNENETRLKRTKAWDFKKSIFAQYKFESDKTYADSLGKDWVAAKTGKFIKDAKELELASEGLKAHYGAFLRLYRRCAAKSYGGSLTFGVSMQTCGELLSQCGVHDDQFCRQSDIDTMFIAARVREKATRAYV